MGEDLTPRVVRLDAFEERFGVRLEGVTAELKQHTDSTFISVLGELYPLEGATLSTDIVVYASAHGEHGEVLSVDYDIVSREGFFGFMPFKITLIPRHGALVASVKVYPR